MTSDLEGRIARVLVASQHPDLPVAKVDELVALGVGRTTAAMIATEVLQTHAPSTRGSAHHCLCEFDGRLCALLAGHDGYHSDTSIDGEIPSGSFVWTVVDQVDPFTTEPHLDHCAALIEQLRDEIAAIRGQSLVPDEPLTDQEVRRLQGAFDGAASPEPTA